MATINLGAIKFNWKGAYNNGTAYTVDDVVSSGGSSYVCIQASTGNAVSNGSYWQVMAQGGDVATTLSTQGDILYRDGSGLQRLAKGTAAQELRMNSGATAPEWHTPAVATSDFVKINSGSFSSVSAVDLDGTSVWGAEGTYKWHQLVFTKWTQSTTANLEGRQINSGTADSSDIYGSHIDYGYSGNDTAYSKGYETDKWQFTQDNLRGTNNSTVHHKLEFNIWGLYGADDNDVCKIRSDVAGINQDGGTPSRRILGFNGANITRQDWGGNQTRTGIRINPASGTVTGNWITYGIKG